jgi:hypothetical protein
MALSSSLLSDALQNSPGRSSGHISMRRTGVMSHEPAHECSLFAGAGRRLSCSDALGVGDT